MIKYRTLVRTFRAIQALSASNQVIAETTAHLDKPLITARTPLFDAGKMVEYFEVSRSLRPLLLETIIVGLLALGFAIAVFAVLRILPMRALHIALNSLRQSEALFSKAFHVSPDPVIIYRVRDGKIINVNHFSR